MPIYIYNSLTRKKDPFEPLNPPQVNMYVCGPTVYDEPHIGHARSAYIFDVIRRYLKYRGYNVKFVRNVTDVDDKIIDRAKKEFPNEDLINAVKKVSSKYLDAYHNDMKSLGILDPDIEPKATEFVSNQNPSMQKFIASLINQGAAYVSGGDVYFDIKKAKNYGKLSNQSIDKMEIGARVLLGENKKDPLDFALWKATKEGEPSWDSPWGKGRPGWHIECSVMSSDILGDKFDIHGGGIDLIFPHHENEIAQSEGLGKEFAKYWIHHGLLTINGQKMAKSLGNFVTIKKFIEDHNDINLLKLFFLSAHYSHPVDFTNENIKEAEKNMQTISNFYSNAMDKLKDFRSSRKNEEPREIAELRNQFIEAMDDNFDMHKSFAVILNLVNLANKNMENINFLYNAKFLLNEIRSVLNFGISITISVPTLELKLKLHEVNVSDEIKVGDNIKLEIIDQYTKMQIAERDKARKEKDYKLADKVRKELEEKGFIVEDTEEGTKIRRKL